MLTGIGGISREKDEETVHECSRGGSRPRAGGEPMAGPDRVSDGRYQIFHATVPESLIAVRWPRSGPLPASCWCRAKSS